MKGEGPRIGLQGELARGRRITLAVASDGSDFKAMTSYAARYPLFEITQEHVDILEEVGIFEMARLLSQQLRKPTEIEDLLKRCIGWFSLSQTQKDKSSEFLSLVIILEVLITKKGAPISAQIADGTAILLADSEADRREIRKITQDIYEIRSSVAHGDLVPGNKDFDTSLDNLRNIVIKLIMTVWELKIRHKLKNETKGDLKDLLDSVKFQGPSVFT